MGGYDLQLEVGRNDFTFSNRRCLDPGGLVEISPRSKTPGHVTRGSGPRRGPTSWKRIEPSLSSELFLMCRGCATPLGSTPGASFRGLRPPANFYDPSGVLPDVRRSHSN